MKLSPTMQRAIAAARAAGGTLCRYPGGYWIPDGKTVSEAIADRVWFTTQTVQALVDRRLAFFSKWARCAAWDYSFPVGDTCFPVGVTIPDPVGVPIGTFELLFPAAWPDNVRVAWLLDRFPGDFSWAFPRGGRCFVFLTSG